MWKCCVQSGNSEQAITSNRILRSERSIAQNRLKNRIEPDKGVRLYLKANQNVPPEGRSPIEKASEPL
jgi:hypothetical protein